LCWRSLRRSTGPQRRRSRWTAIVRALELTLLVEHHLELLFERHASEKRIDGLAASDAVFIFVAPAVGAGEKMLNTGLRLWQRLLAEEAKPTLREHEAVEGRRGHKASNEKSTP